MTELLVRMTQKANEIWQHLRHTYEDSTEQTYTEIDIIYTSLYSVN
jgi:hypothetical protein